MPKLIFFEICRPFHSTTSVRVVKQNLNPASIQEPLRDVDQLAPQALGDTFTQDVVDTTARDTAVQMVEEQDVHGPDAGQLETLDALAPIVLVAQQLLDLGARQQAAQPQVLVGVADVEADAALGGLVAGAGMDGVAEWNGDCGAERGGGEVGGGDRVVGWLVARVDVCE
jgi:hypothetical protein